MTAEIEWNGPSRASEPTTPKSTSTKKQAMRDENEGGSDESKPRRKAWEAENEENTRMHVADEPTPHPPKNKWKTNNRASAQVAMRADNEGRMGRESRAIYGKAGGRGAEVS
jgi:hypothetical protein